MRDLVLFRMKFITPRKLGLFPRPIFQIMGMFILFISCEEPGEKVDLDTGPKIVFESARNGISEIYIMDVGGNNQTRLTQDNLEYINPQYSPDGRKILYESGNGDYDIFIMDADGSNQTNLTKRHGWDHSAQVSPDGSQIVYASYRDGDSEIYIMDSDGLNALHLTPGPAAGFNPRFSPDGSLIVFEILLPGSVRNIATVDIFGGKPVLLTERDRYCTLPQYSPDGSKILFLFNRKGVGYHDLYVMDADGGNQTKLETKETVSIYEPQFSPDGSKIAYVTKYWGRNPVLNMINTDGTGETILNIDPPRGLFPQFSSDGSQIVFLSLDQGERKWHGRRMRNDIYILYLDDMKTVQLTTEGAYAPNFRPQF